MLVPTLPDWKVEAVGDDIAWMKFGEADRLYPDLAMPMTDADPIGSRSFGSTKPNLIIALARTNSLNTS
jgi:phosphoenolpyruvate carboxykinase (GTP)